MTQPKLPPDRRTIAVAVSNGFSARYLLRTEIFARLKERGARLVIITPNADEAYMREEFESEDVAVERYEFDKCRAYFRKSRLQNFFRMVRWHTMPGIAEDSVIHSRFGSFKKECYRGGLKGRIRFRLIAASRALLSRSAGLRKAFLSLECRLFIGNFHRALFDHYRPDLLVTTSLGYFDFDQYIMREAGRRNVKTAAIILSWDNSSSKGLPGARADSVVAWSDTMKQELIKHYEVPADKIYVGGVAHFDLYYHPDGLLGRDALFRRYGLDPARKLIFFGTRSPNKYPWTGDCIRIMAEAIEQNRFSAPCQLLVRIHPNHYHMQNGTLRYRGVLDEFAEIKKRHARVFFNEPKILSFELPGDMPASEMLEVGSILKHADVMVNYYSTLMLEASIFDLPIINLVKYGHNAQLGKDSRAVIKFEHIQRVINRKAERTVFSDEELITAINEYLDHREKEAGGRSRVAAEECGPNHGSAGKAIADYLLSLAS